MLLGMFSVDGSSMMPEVLFIADEENARGGGMPETNPGFLDEGAIHRDMQEEPIRVFILSMNT